MRGMLKGLVLAGLAAVTLPAQGKTVKYYHVDAVGSVRVVTDASGAVVERHDYLPFGEECTTGGCASNPLLGAGEPRKYTGKERDKETGLDYFGARYYGAKTGRFTAIDPVYTWNENLVDPQRWNRYAYVRNNPLRFTDPDGRAAREMTGAQVAQLQARAAAAGPSNDPVAGAVAAAGLVLTGAPLAIMGGEAAPALARALIAWFAVPGNQAKVQEVGEAMAGGPPGARGAARAGLDAGEGLATSPVGRLGSPLEVRPGTNAPASIGGRTYTGHALDRMQGRGLTPTVVEDTIGRGAEAAGRGGATVHTTEQARVVLNPDKSVKTVYPQ